MLLCVLYMCEIFLSLLLINTYYTDLECVAWMQVGWFCAVLKLFAKVFSLKNNTANATSISWRPDFTLPRMRRRRDQRYFVGVVTD